MLLVFAMYMYLRYGDQCKTNIFGCLEVSTGTFDDMVDLFLQWNAEDPVSEVEKANENPYHENLSNPYAQGNRNPFIDNPILATRIWGGPVAEDRWGIYTTGDTEIPSVPTNLMISNETTSSIDLDWTASIDNIGVSSYDVFVNGTLSTSVTTNSVTISSLNQKYYI